jgi:poly(A) polymerase
MTRLDSQPWMTAAETRAVMAALGEARFVGGAVRNALLGRKVEDVDIATPLAPAEVSRRLEAAGLKAVPTGIEHGTITAVAGGKPFEVTTLRHDVETDGRHAVVAFTADWAEDARRRDFTMNALYADAEGEVFDYVGGVADLTAGRVRFVGDATTRIREDYLRILRLFRFHAWYGAGDMDADGLQAAAREKASLKTLSGERLQKEMLRLIEAPSPVAVLRTMSAAGILGELLGGETRLPRLERLAQIDADNFFAPDAVLRLAALLGAADAQRVAAAWRLSNAHAERLEAALDRATGIVPYLSPREVRKLLYRLGAARFRDQVFLGWAEDPKDSHTVQWRALLAMAESWRRPQFPVSGRDVMQAGVPEGPLVGRVLGEVEQWWIDSDFTDDEFSLAERLKSVAQAVVH